MEGYLKKKSPKTVFGKHPWQKRWFVLQDTSSGVRVAYFKTDKDAHTPLSEPLGVIPLDRMVNVELMAHKVGRFNVHVEGNRIFALWASSTVEAQKWIAQISNLRSNSRETLSALDKDKKNEKFWKNGAASSTNAVNKPDPLIENKVSPGASASGKEVDAKGTSIGRRPSLVKCEGFLNKDIKSKDGQKAKGFCGRFWCRATERTLFFFQPEMAHKENATAMGYLSLRDIVNSDFKEMNAWFHLETREEVWTLSVSDNGDKSFATVDETTIAKAKSWFAAINRFLQDQPRDTTEVFKHAEEEIKIQQERRTQSQPKKEDKPEMQTSPKPAEVTRPEVAANAIETRSVTHRQRQTCCPCGCFGC